MVLFFIYKNLFLLPLMRKKIITIFFLLLFTTQLLPIKQIGQLIAGATMTEELPGTGHSSTAKFIDSKWLHGSFNTGNMNALANSSQSCYIHFSETLPCHLASDVQTPPPNIFC